MVGENDNSKNMSLDKFIDHLKQKEIPISSLYKKDGLYHVKPIEQALDKITNNYKEIMQDSFKEYKELQKQQREIADQNRKIKLENKKDRLKKEKIPPVKIKLSKTLEKRRYNNLIKVSHVLGVLDSLREGKIAGVKLKITRPIVEKIAGFRMITDIEKTEIDKLWPNIGYTTPYHLKARVLKHHLQKFDFEFKKSYDSWKRIQNARTYRYK